MPYHTLVWGEADEAALCAAHAATYRSSIPSPYFERYIRIPWEPSMGVPENIPWIGQDE